MANDLTDLDPTLPTATDLVSEGDDRMREERLKIRNWADVEHHRDGPHKVPFGAPGVRPAAGHAGRLFVDTTNERIELDNGTTWLPVSSSGGAVITAFQSNAYAAAQSTTTAESAALVSILLATSGGRVFLALAHSMSSRVQPGVNGHHTIVRLKRDGSTIATWQWAFGVTVNAYSVPIPQCYFSEVPSAGFHLYTVTFQTEIASLNVSTPAANAGFLMGAAFAA